MINFTSENQIWRWAVGLIILTSLLSLGLHWGQPLQIWLGAWLMDLSTDLAGSALVILALRWMLKPPAPKAPPEDIISPEPTYFIEAVELPSLNTHPRASLLRELQAATTREKRQQIINQLQTWGLAGEDLAGADWEGLVLDGLNLEGANLAGAKLRSSSLQGVNLSRANLSMAQLIEANLSGANLQGATLEKTFLSGANLSGVNLRGAMVKCMLWRVNLAGADLSSADLSGAELFHTNLSDAILAGVHLAGVRVNTNTILPDGKPCTQESDLARFT